MKQEEPTKIKEQLLFGRELKTLERYTSPMGSMDGGKATLKERKSPRTEEQKQKAWIVASLGGEEVAERGARPEGNLEGPGMTCILVIT